MLDFVRNQWTPLPYPETSFKDQVVIVTGANQGLGLEAARHFARLDAAKVILGCRSLPRGEEAVRSIEETTGRKGVCEVWQVDLGSWASVKEFTRRAEGLERLDVVVENAGIARSYFVAADDGFESGVATNVVGTFLMALNLLSVLRRSSKKTGIVPRLVIVSSEVHAWSKLEERNEESIFDALNKDEPKYMRGRYPTTKLLEVFFVRSLSREMQNGPHASEKVILNTVNPGLCHSSLTRDAKGARAIVVYLLKLLMARTTEMGSRTLVASAVAGEESHGEYMSGCKVCPSSEFVRSEEGRKTQERVYTELMGILEKIQPGISKNV